MKLYIKNMVCDRCKMVIKAEMEKLGFKVNTISLGVVEIGNETVSDEKLNQLDKRLQELGFQRINDKTSRTIEKIKTFVIRNIHQSNTSIKSNWSELISNELKLDYNYLSNLFSSVEGMTIEQFIIRQKIEKAKELLFYDELNLNEIAYELGYSSTAYLSSQFKKVTGLTPSNYKKVIEKGRKELDNL